MERVDKTLLERLSADTSAEGKHRLVEAVSSLFLEEDRRLGESERGVVYDILRLTIHEMEMEVRHRISERIAEHPDIPLELAKTLANDEIEIAYPILILSPVLGDDDLIEVIENRSQLHQVAVTLRESVSEKVTDALVANGGVNVVCSLLKNSNARIGSETLNRLALESRNIEAYQEPLLHRSDLPQAVIEKMFGWVTLVLRQYILDHSKIAPERLDALLEDAVIGDIEQADRTDGMQNRASDPSGSEKSIAASAVEAVRGGWFMEFSQLFEERLGIPHGIMLRAIADNGGEGLTIACKAGDIGQAAFASVIAFVRRHKTENEKVLRKEIQHYMKLFESIDKDSALDIADAWAQSHDYHGAMRHLRLR